MRRYGQHPQAATRTRRAPWQAPRWLGSLGRVMTGIGLLVVAVAVVGLGALLYRWMDSPVSRVAVVSPLERVRQAELEAIVADSLEGGFLSLDIDALCVSLEAHPWIAQATVRRYWPDRIEIAVLEEVAIARWGDHGFLNQRGQISHLGDTGELSELPYLSGPEGSIKDVMGEYQDISQLLLVEGLKVSEFGMDKHRRWRMRLDTGFSVWLGQSHVLAKVRRFLLAWSDQLKMRKDEILVVDARYENGVAVSWR